LNLGHRPDRALGNGTFDAVARLESVQAFLGHESIVTTRTVYARTWNEVLEDHVATYRPSPAEAERAVKAAKPRANH
jgi:integrase